MRSPCETQERAKRRRSSCLDVRLQTAMRQLPLAVDMPAMDDADRLAARRVFALERWTWMSEPAGLCLMSAMIGAASSERRRVEAKPRQDKGGVADALHCGAVDLGEQPADVVEALGRTRPGDGARRRCSNAIRGGPGGLSPWRSVKMTAASMLAGECRAGEFHGAGRDADFANSSCRRTHPPGWRPERASFRRDRAEADSWRWLAATPRRALSSRRRAGSGGAPAPRVPRQSRGVTVPPNSVGGSD